MRNCPVPIRETSSGTSSRRRVLGLMLGASGWLPAALTAAGSGEAVRLAISESLVSDVNLNDARAAMITWIKRMMADLNLTVELSPRIFDSSEEILRRARSGQLDAVALNVLEYRQIADVLDPTEIIYDCNSSGLEQYVLLAKRNGGIHQLGDLRGRSLRMLKAPKMCAAGAWLSNILDDGHFGPSEQFFGSVTADTKTSRVVLPVFFGQSDACLATRHSFDTMCELNPQVGKDLAVIATSPAMVVTFYVFHKNYHGANRDRFARVYTQVSSSVSGRQLAMLFQFEKLVITDVACLASSLALVEKAERVRGRQRVGDRKR